MLIACVILHNMVIDDEQGEVLERTIELQHNIQMKRGLTFIEYIQSTKEIKNLVAYYNLRNDLVDHLWALKGLNHF